MSSQMTKPQEIRQPFVDEDGNRGTAVDPRFMAGEGESSRDGAYCRRDAITIGLRESWGGRSQGRRI